MLTAAATEHVGIFWISAWELLNQFHSHSVDCEDESLDNYLAQQAQDGGHHWTSLDRIEFRWLRQPA